MDSARSRTLSERPKPTFASMPQYRPQVEPPGRDVALSCLIFVNTSRHWVVAIRDKDYYLFYFGRRIMSRHLDNLKRLFQKLQVRYGEDDAIVVQAKQEMESRQAIESRYPVWPRTHTERRSGKATGRQWNAASLRSS
jgi:hypothetical protein